MSTIALNILPIELWNIVLTFTPHYDAKHFIYIALVYKSLSTRELDGLKNKYIYDFLISTKPLHKCIYNIYNTIDTINTPNKYFKEFNKVYQIVSTCDSYDRNYTVIVKNFLADKITNEKQRRKFNNLTKKIVGIDEPPTTTSNTDDANMFRYLR
tara:strand:- start:115 stop:579 length:465 start_codon:yes stop_codon:yes gene_type:complete